MRVPILLRMAMGTTLRPGALMAASDRKVDDQRSFSGGNQVFKLSNWKPWEILAFGTLAAAGLGAMLMMISAPEGEEDWAEFKEKHHCVSVAKERGGDGAGWYCDDGEIHYRWRQQK